MSFLDRFILFTAATLLAMGIGSVVYVDRASASSAVNNFGPISSEVLGNGAIIFLDDTKAGDTWQVVGPAPYDWKRYGTGQSAVVSCPDHTAGVPILQRNVGWTHWIKRYDTSGDGPWKQVGESDFYLTCPPPWQTEEPPDATPPVLPPGTVTPPPAGGPPLVELPPGVPTPPATPDPVRSVQIGKVGPTSSRPNTFQRYRLVAINRGNVAQRVTLRDVLPVGVYLPFRAGDLNGLKVRNGVVTWTGTLRPGQRVIKQFYFKASRPAVQRCQNVSNRMTVRGPGLGTLTTGWSTMRVCSPLVRRPSIPVTG